MKLAVLTTETLHHAQFVRALAAQHALRVFVEPGVAPAAYPTHHAFEDERDEVERALWFDGRSALIADFAATECVEDINSPGAAARLRSMRPELVIVFGTRRLRAEILDVLPGRIVNLHGGDPEQYRGLDTHLWAIWHREFAQIVTTIHHMDLDLDTGAVLDREPVIIRRGMRLCELRAANTATCTRLAERVIARFSLGAAPGVAQRQRGRYYSAMPSDLKAVCVRRFQRFTEEL